MRRKIISRKHLNYLLFSIILFGAALFVQSFGGNNAAEIGHSGGEIEVNTLDGVQNINSAIAEIELNIDYINDTINNASGGNVTNSSFSCYYKSRQNRVGPAFDGQDVFLLCNGDADFAFSGSCIPNPSTATLFLDQHYNGLTNEGWYCDSNGTSVDIGVVCCTI